MASGGRPPAGLSQAFTLPSGRSDDLVCSPKILQGCSDALTHQPASRAEQGESRRDGTFHIFEKQYLSSVENADKHVTENQNHT
jgi:hypothetical protein